MMKSHKRGVIHVNLALAVLYLLGEVPLANAEDDCVPDAGGSGALKSVVLIIQQWESKFANFHFSDPVLISTDSYTVPKSSKASTLPGSANVRFYGEDLCVAVTKITEVERLDGTIDRSSVCQKSCFGVGGGDSLDTYSGTFGRPMDTDPLCCYYGRTDTLRFSIPTPPTLPPPSYECMKCFDCDAPGAKSSIQTCDPGDKCFTVKLQHLKKENNLTTIKGCSHRLQHWGEDLYCDYQCEYNVPLWDVPGPYIYYKICVSCCSGNKCNVNKAAPGAGSRGHMHTLFITVLFSVFAAI